jgi:hypothetical protein
MVLFSAAVLFAFNRVESYVNENGNELIGRKVYLRSLNANLLNARVILKDLTIYEPNEIDSFLHIKKLSINLNLMSMLNGHYLIDDIKLDGFEVNVTQSQGNFNFQDIVMHIKAKTQPEESTESEEPSATWAIEKFSITNSKATYTDSHLPYPLHLDDLNLESGTGLRSEKSDFLAEINFTLNKKAKVEFDIDYKSSTESFYSNLNLNHLGFENINPFIEPVINFKSIDGLVASKLNLAGTIKDPANLDISGQLSIDSFSFINPENEELIGFKQLNVVIDSLNAVEDLYAIHSVAIDGLAGGFHVYVDGHNFQSLAKETPIDTAMLETKEAIENLGVRPTNYLQQLVEQIRETIDNYKANNIHIDSIMVTNGDLFFYDHVPKDVFKCHLTNFNAFTHDFYFDRDSVNIDVSSTLNFTSSLKSNVTFYPHHKEDLSITVFIEDFDMKGLSPYSYSYLGHDIDSGFLKLETSIRINDNYLNSKNHLSITSLELDKKVRHDEALKVPIKAGISALTDKDGLLELDLPLSGDLSDPNFKAGPLVKQALRNTFIKAASLPGRTVKKVVSRKKRDKG